MLPINLTLEKAVEVLNYPSNWSVDMDTIAMDLMVIYPGYVISWYENDKKFKSREEKQVDDYTDNK